MVVRLLKALECTTYDSAIWNQAHRFGANIVRVRAENQKNRFGMTQVILLILLFSSW